jgi:aspartyl protease family protein
MLFDTGASDISISQTEVDFMIKNGFLSEQDYIGTARYTLANGEKEVSRTIMLREVEIGGLVLKNVRASVSKNRTAGMLFGQSAMGRYGKITIDNKKKQIVLTGDGK